MDETTDNIDRLAGEGVALVIGGHQLTARFTMRSLKDLEKEHGSIIDVGKLLQRLADPAQNTGPDAVPMYGTVVSLMALALRYEHVDDEPVTEDWILDHADPRRVVDYERLVFRALQLAMPAADERDATDPTTPPKTAATNASPGRRSSGSPSREAA